MVVPGNVEKRRGSPRHYLDGIRRDHAANEDGEEAHLAETQLLKQWIAEKRRMRSTGRLYRRFGRSFRT